VKKVWEFYGTPEETPNTLAALPRGRFRGPPSAGCQGDEEIAKNFRKRFVLAIVGIILDDWRLEVAPGDRAGFVNFREAPVNSVRILGGGLFNPRAATGFQHALF
jgi:hypothetical protein